MEKFLTKIEYRSAEFKTYHVSYFNSLKSYIESLDIIDAISAITYSMEIPEEFQSDVLKVLLKNYKLCQNAQIIGEKQVCK